MLEDKFILNNERKISILNIYNSFIDSWWLMVGLYSMCRFFCEGVLFLLLNLIFFLVRKSIKMLICFDFVKIDIIDIWVWLFNVI